MLILTSVQLTNLLCDQLTDCASDRPTGVYLADSASDRPTGFHMADCASYRPTGFHLADCASDGPTGFHMADCAVTGWLATTWLTVPVTGRPASNWLTVQVTGRRASIWLTVQVTGRPADSAKHPTVWLCKWPTDQLKMQSVQLTDCASGRPTCWQCKASNWLSVQVTGRPGSNWLTIGRPVSNWLSKWQLRKQCMHPSYNHTQNFSFATSA